MNIDVFIDKQKTEMFLEIARLHWHIKEKEPEVTLKRFVEKELQTIYDENLNLYTGSLHVYGD